MLDAKLHYSLLQKNLYLLNVHLPETMLRQGLLQTFKRILGMWGKEGHSAKLLQKRSMLNIKKNTFSHRVVD